MLEFLWLLTGTIVHRPYVYGFLCCYVFFSEQQLGWRKSLSYLVIAYLVAFTAEFCSTRFGLPFGMYVYLDASRTQELWLSNIPFWDPLSFVFLSYFSWNLAAAVLSRSLAAEVFTVSLRSRATCLLAGFLMMLLDVIIDPLTLQGDRWFLGRIYYYPHGGTYFGVTLSNFAGWWFVGTVTPWIFQRLTSPDFRKVRAFFVPGVFGVYAGVLLFNLAITAYIRDWTLFSVSTAISLITLALTGRDLRKKVNAYA